MAEKLEDLHLPIAVVQRIIKEAISDNINIGKDARTALARAAAVFVIYTTSHASQMAQRVNRKTLIGQDILDALNNLEFEELAEPLKQSLMHYKETLKKKERANKITPPEGEDGEVVEEIDEEIEEDNELT